MKDYIFAFKEDSKAVAEFINIAYESPQDYKSIESKLQSSYHKIEKLNQTHSAMKMSDGKAFPARDAAFERFDKSVNDFLAQARKMMRNASENGQITQDDLDALARNEETIQNLTILLLIRTPEPILPSFESYIQDSEQVFGFPCR